MQEIVKLKQTGKPRYKNYSKMPESRSTYHSTASEITDMDKWKRHKKVRKQLQMWMRALYELQRSVHVKQWAYNTSDIRPRMQTDVR